MKDFDPKEPSKGLGDTLAKITHAIKLDLLALEAAKALGYEDCGCKRRRDKLNELIPYKKQDDATEGE